MYYLLEDNSIVDSENLPKNVKIERIAKDDKDNAFFIQIQYLDFLKTRKIGYIKKQSENVYDFIDWENDLVRVAWSNGKNFIIDCNINKSDFSDGYYSLDWITAIYKPDEKGNYIKAWEVKEDEKE